MIFKTPLLCDRRVYDKKGKWKSPNNDIEENIFYYIKTARTLEPSYHNAGEELAETMTIVVFGGKAFGKEDKITLEDGSDFDIQNITINYVEHNILVKDMLKPRIASIELELA